MEGKGGITEVGVEEEEDIKGLIDEIRRGGRGGGEEVRRKRMGKDREHSWVGLKEEKNNEDK